MRGFRGWPLCALAFALLPATVAPLAAQQDPESEKDDERCVCVDAEEVRERVRRSMERAREGMARARRQVRIAHDRLESRARLGVGIDYDQGARWDTLGVRVTDVPDGSPAAEAGIRRGDVIVSLDGRRLTSALADSEDEDDLEEERSLPVQRLALLVRKREPGDEAEVGYLRDGEEATVTVELAAGTDLLAPVRALRLHGGPPRPHPGPATQGRELERELREELRRGLAPLRWAEACPDLGGDGPFFGGGPCVAGLRVTRLNPELGEYFGTDDGVLVTEVAEDSPLGLRPGDVIRGVGERDVEDPADFLRILGSYEEGEEARLRIRRGGEDTEVRGTVP